MLPLLLLSCKGVGRGMQPTAPTPRVQVAQAVGERVVMPMRFQTLLYSNYDATIQPRVSGYLLTKQFSNPKKARGLMSKFKGMGLPF